MEPPPAASPPSSWPDLLERAIRLAARAHHGQRRQATSPPLPYLSHPTAVALILARLGFANEVIAAGLLHDVIEDTGVDLATIAAEFGPAVADLVAANSERKLDPLGHLRPWLDRKRESLDHLAAASVEARAVALADKLHNLLSIEFDLARGTDVWTAFKAGRVEVLAYYREAVDRWGAAEARLAPLVAEFRTVLHRLKREDPPGAVDG